MQSFKRVPFFLATFVINLLGSFLLGIATGYGWGESLTQFVAIGFLGAFTTFSTFSLEVIQLFEQQKQKVAFGYLIISIIFGILFAFLGLIIIQ